MIGSFSGGGLGMGVVFTLNDQFSRTADKIRGKMGVLSSDTDRMVARIDKSMNQLKTGAMLAGVGIALTIPFVRGIKNASDYSENLNKLRVAFGDYADEVIKFSSNSLTDFGISKITSSNMAAMWGDMATNMGISQKGASKLAMSLVGLAGDMSSFKNIEHSIAQTALNAIFTGETESLKMLGIVMTEQNLKLYAMSEGYKTQYKNMTQAERVMLRYNYILSVTKNSQGDFLRTQMEYANQHRIFLGTLEEVSIALGQILLPMVTKFYIKISALLNRFKEFAESPIGKAILRVTVALGGLLIIVGASLIIFAGLRWMFIMMSVELKILAVNLKSAFIPLTIVLSSLLFLYKAWTSFSNYDPSKSKAGGILGFFQTLGGYLQTAVQVWRSWNGETYLISEELENKLKALKIWEDVQRMATWLVRIKEFMKGVFDGIKEGFGIIMGVINNIGKVVVKFLSMIGIDWDKNTSKINHWKTAGKIAGAVIMGVLSALIIHMTALGIQTLIAFAAPIIMFIGVKLLIIGIILVVGYLSGAFEWLGNSVLYILGRIREKIIALKNWFLTLGAAAYTLGKDFVKSIWRGIKSAWQSMLSGLKSLWNNIKSLFGFGDTEVEAKVKKNVETSISVSEKDVKKREGNLKREVKSTHHEVTSKTPTVVYVDKHNRGMRQEESKPIVVNNYMDGELISSKVMEKQEFKQARR